MRPNRRLRVHCSAFKLPCYASTPFFTSLDPALVVDGGFRQACNRAILPLYQRAYPHVRYHYVHCECEWRGLFDHS